MGDIEKYIIYGETFNTKDKLSKEEEKFLELLHYLKTEVKQ
jgi:hypothetical protein